MRTLVLLIMSVLGLNLTAQTFQVGKRTCVLYDQERGKRRITADIYYPSLSEGSNVSIDTSSCAFPLICFGHGFVMNVSSYSNIWQTLVPAGFIVAFPKTETGIAPSHLALAKDISFVISYLQKESNTPGCFFYHRIASTSCAMGHSMGAGSALLAASFNKDISSLVLLAPAETRPSAIKASESIKVPSIVFSGTNDCVTPPSKHHLPIFEALKGSNKLFISIIGGNHCNMADDNRLCDLAEATCKNDFQISRNEQQAIINRYLLPWLRCYLKGDKDIWPETEKQLAVDKEINCINP